LHVDLLVEGEVPVDYKRVVLVENVSLNFLILLIEAYQLCSHFGHPHSFHLLLELLTSVDRFGVNLFLELLRHRVCLEEVLATHVCGKVLAEGLNLGLNQGCLVLAFGLDALPQVFEELLCDGVVFQAEFS